MVERTFGKNLYRMVLGVEGIAIFIMDTFVMYIKEQTILI